MEFLKGFLAPEILWFLIGLFLILAEFIIPGLLIIFFGVGALIAALYSWIFNPGINTQLIVFIASSVFLLAILRKKMKSIFFGKEDQRQQAGEDLEELIGQKAVAITDIVGEKNGKVEFHGTNWTAESDENISAGSIVEIIGKNSITLKVKTFKKQGE